MKKVMPKYFKWRHLIYLALFAAWLGSMYYIGASHTFTGPFIVTEVRNGEILHIQGTASLHAASQEDFILRNLKNSEELIGASEKNLPPIGWKGSYHSIIEEEITGEWIVEKGEGITVHLKGSSKLELKTVLNRSDVWGLRAMITILIILVIAVILGEVFL